MHQKLNPSFWKLCTAKLSSHGGCQMKQVPARPNKLFSLTPIDDVTRANEPHSKPACYIHGPAQACNLFKARTRNSAMESKGGCDTGAGAVSLNISVLPSPAERNCVIMLACFYDSNQGYCLWKRPAPLCATEQPRYYTAAAENESAAIGWGAAGWIEAPVQHTGRGGSRGGDGDDYCLPLCYRVNTLSYLQFINCKHTNKQLSVHGIGCIPVCHHNT